MQECLLAHVFVYDDTDDGSAADRPITVLQSYPYASVTSANRELLNEKADKVEMLFPRAYYDANKTVAATISTVYKSSGYHPHIYDHHIAHGFLDSPPHNDGFRSVYDAYLTQARSSLVWAYFERAEKPGCAHGPCGARLQCPVCSRYFSCARCHDEDVADHVLPLAQATTMQCIACGADGSLGTHCSSCRVEVAKVHCKMCNTLTGFPPDVQPMTHCAACGTCRLGLPHELRHCDQCRMCLPAVQFLQHRHVPDDLSCIICFDDLRQSLDAFTELPCGNRHYAHYRCYREMLHKGIMHCALCHKYIISKRSVTEYERRVLFEPWMRNVLQLKDYCLRAEPKTVSRRDSEYIVVPAIMEVACHECMVSFVGLRNQFGLYRCSNCRSFNTTATKELQFDKQSGACLNYGMPNVLIESMPISSGEPPRGRAKHRHATDSSQANTATLPGSQEPSSSNASEPGSCFSTFSRISTHTNVASLRKRASANQNSHADLLRALENTPQPVSRFRAAPPNVLRSSPKVSREGPTTATPTGPGSPLVKRNTTGGSSHGKVPLGITKSTGPQHRPPAQAGTREPTSTAKLAKMQSPKLPADSTHRMRERLGMFVTRKELLALIREDLRDVLPDDTLAKSFDEFLAPPNPEFNDDDTSDRSECPVASPSSDELTDAIVDRLCGP